MKRTLILLCILLLLVLAYFTMTKGDGKSTSIRMEDREFITTDPDEVQTITIKAKARPEIHISRRKDAWYINGKYRASKNVTDNMLNVLNKMSIKYIPMKAENETALRRMDKFGLDIKTFDKEGIVLTDFILGPNISTEYGTYVKKRGAEQVYVMQMHVTEGALVSFFNHSVTRMRDLNIISIPSDNLNSVSVDYPKHKTNSFVIQKEGKAFTMETQRNDNRNKAPNANLADAFFKDFINVNAENFLNDIMYKDSIKALLPFVSLELDLKEGDDIKLDVYPFVDLTTKYVTRSLKDLTSRHDAFYVHSSWGDWYHVQRKFLENLMKKPEDFY